MRDRVAARDSGPGQADTPARSGAASAPGRRQPYEKPRLHTVSLAADEVLAVGCKLDGGPGGPIGANCTSSSCFAAGS